jgi:hypothetical protein
MNDIPTSMLLKVLITDENVANVRKGRDIM